MEKWTTNPKEVYRGPVFSVLSGTAQLDDGTTVTRDVVHHQGSVAIVAMHGDCVLLISQSRIAAGKPVLEIPAGRIDIEKDKTPEDAALRELREETGYDGKVQPGPVYYSSVGFLDESVHIFFALNVERIPDPERIEKPDPDEQIRTEWIPLSEIARDLRTYRFNDSKTIIGLRELLAYLNLNDQMVDDKSLYAWYSDENHKYNTLIWQFPIAIVGLNVLAVERLWQSAPLMALLWLINNVLLLCVGKHVYHQRRFTNALKEIARRFLIMHPNAPVVTFPRPKGNWWLPLTNFPVTYLLFWSLFLLNQILLLVFLWLHWYRNASL